MSDDEHETGPDRTAPGDGPPQPQPEPEATGPDAADRADAGPLDAEPAEAEPAEAEPEEAAEAEPEEIGVTAAAADADTPGEPAREPSGGAAAPGRDPAMPRRRRLSAAGAVIGLLLGLLGFAFVVQLRSNSTDEQLSADRPEDLVRILSDLDARKDRLSQEISTLQTTEQQLTAGSQNRQAALDEATRRADELGILAGTLQAQGPGLRVEFRSAAKPIQAADLLNAVEELRGAGAEAMQITGSGGTAVRIIASTSFVDGSGGGLVVDGTALTSPYTVTAIGDPPTMQIALNIPNGVVDDVHTHGGNVTITSPGTVLVSALHPVTNPRYAQPVG
jgi:uncharacterized protein YlxW (UPF0749 family)